MATSAFVWLWTAAVAWILFRLFQVWRSLRPLPPARAPASNDPRVMPPLVSVIVPARNEAANIEACLGGLVTQTWPRERLEILVVDDDSTDATAAIVARLAAGHPGIGLLGAGALPPGWTGKAHACWVGAAAARGDWLCFVDADTHAHPELIASAMAYARLQRLHLLSLQPGQELGTFWERLILPLGYTCVGLITHLDRANDPARPDAVANGQFILAERAAYRSVSGHAANPDAVVEDIALARRFKGERYRVALLDGRDHITTRMYRGLGDLWEGLSRDGALLMGGARRWQMALAPLAAALFLMAAAAAPAAGWAAWGTQPTSWTLAQAAAATFASLALWLVLTWSDGAIWRVPVWYALLWPLAGWIGVGILSNSFRRVVTGHNTWKNRVLPGAH